MGTLIFVCPATGAEVSTGIEMEPETPAAVGAVKRLLPTLPPAAPNGWHSVLASPDGTAREHALRGCESSVVKATERPGKRPQGES